MTESKDNIKNDFSKGSVIGAILSLAVPMTMAQLIHILYNIVDRIFIGRIPGEGTLPITGLGLCTPIISIIMAFANLFGGGGAPLCSIERGRGNLKKAEEIVGNAFTMLLISGILLITCGYLFMHPLLYAFGASDATYPYASGYLSIYLLGTLFVMISLGLNAYINAQGFARIGMLTTLIGCVMNIILDPIFIFVLHMGIKGAAIATVIAQAISAAWTLQFMTGKKTILRITPSVMRLDLSILKDIVALGLSHFCMSITNSVVQVVCNASLSHYGGDMYVGVMTVINSIREVIHMPVSGITGGSQPVIAFNNGAKKKSRIKTAVTFMSVTSLIYGFVSWILLRMFPAFFIRVFNTDPELVAAAIPAMNLYFYGFFFQTFQTAGQTVFQAFKRAKHAIFFSIFRKVIIVTPLTLLLPHFWNPSYHGVFAAEPISNLVGGLACFITMLFMLREEFKKPQWQDAK